MPVYQSGLTSELDRRQRTRRSLTGRSLTWAESAAPMEEVLANDYNKSVAAEERAQRLSIANRELNLREEAQKDADLAAMAGGVGDIALGGANVWLGSKYLSLMGARGAGGAGVGATGGAAGAPAGALTPYVPATAPALVGAEVAAPATIAPAAAGPGLATVAGASALGAGALYAGGKYTSDKLNLEKTFGKVGGRTVGMAIAPIVAPTLLVADLGKKAWDSFKNLF